MILGKLKIESAQFRLVEAVDLQETCFLVVFWLFGRSRLIFDSFFITMFEFSYKSSYLSVRLPAKILIY